MPIRPHEGGHQGRRQLTFRQDFFFFFSFGTPVISASILSSISIPPSQKILTHDVTEYIALVVAQDVTGPSGENECRLPVHPYKEGELRAEDVSHFGKDLKCLSFRGADRHSQEDFNLPCSAGQTEGTRIRALGRGLCRRGGGEKILLLCLCCSKSESGWMKISGLVILSANVG